MKEITISKDNFTKISRFVLNEFKEEFLNKGEGNDEGEFFKTLVYITVLTLFERLEQLLFDENQKTND